ncbi:hypothetical protein [Longispora fulva]|uniref:Uncharacterized protein n=1 Tax=Longispora fulva TaxID=619741 RepID=A0A8J7GED7_9ACTN|nr:hypothetical protein [Longispora fulva]MBG6136330.1 hypothetical protein [Longispora fulva]
MDAYLEERRTDQLWQIVGRRLDTRRGSGPWTDGAPGPRLILPWLNPARTYLLRHSQAAGWLVRGRPTCPDGTPAQLVNALGGAVADLPLLDGLAELGSSCRYELRFTRGWRLWQVTA